MTREEALDKLCHSYSGYFDVVRHEEPKGYLVAEAGLHIHSEKYVLVKAAKLWEADNNEYVYIFSVPVLTKEIFEQCREQARSKRAAAFMTTSSARSSSCSART